MSIKILRIPLNNDQAKYAFFAACSDRGDCELLNFLGSLPDSGPIIRCIEEAAKDGPHALQDSRSHLINKDNKLYELISGRVRVVFFTDSNRVVICTHGFIKKSQKSPKLEVEKAIRIRNKYFKSKSDNKIIELDE